MMKNTFNINQKKYHEELNQSYNGQDYYLDWENYRNEIATLCTQVVGQSIIGSKITIVGAGHLNDVSLHPMLEASEITLLDIDYKTMCAGVMRQELQNSEIIQYKVCDLTGLDAFGFLDELSVLMGYHDVSGIERFLLETKIEIQLEIASESQDVLIVTPIYTQILLSQYLEMIHIAGLQEFSDRLITCFLSFISRVIYAINESLLTILKVGGKLIVWSDILEYATEQSIFQNLSKDGSQTTLKSHIESYEIMYGKGVGTFGIEQISEFIYLTNEHFLIWPFNKQRHMIVRLIGGIKQDSC